MLLSGSHAVFPVLMRSASCRYPVCICWCLFDLSCEWSTAGQVKEFPWLVPHVHSVIVQSTFCPFLIRHIIVLFVIHLLHVRLLIVFYPLLVRYVCASYDFSRRSSPHLDDFHHWINSFCIFYVCNLYLCICDSTIDMWQHHYYCVSGSIITRICVMYENSDYLFF